jgi:site-specific recombinase
MTASLIAKTIPVGKTDADSLEGLAVMISRISRSQFISFVGNLAGAIPFASILAWGFYLLADFHIATPDKATRLITELHPLMSGSLYYASVAGVMLFLSGVVSGYYDNKIVYRKIPDRVRQHITLKKIFGKQRMNRFADYIDGNLGALMGNFALGMMLGAAGTLGFILGLPLDIRHITFAGGNFALGFAGLNANVALGDIAVTFLGIVGIGFFNFTVSFSLALSTAARSRNIRVLKQYKIIAAVARLFRRYPMEFIYPTKRACERPGEAGAQNK